MNDIYNKLSDEYDKFYLQNIYDFKKKSLEDNLSNDYFVDFYPSFGINENEKTDFLIFGQAVNGWGSGFSIEDEDSNISLYDSLISSNGFLKEKKHTPLDWVNIQWTESQYQKYCQDESISNFYKSNYRACRSFFWNVTYKLISDYYNIKRSSFDWARKMVWSNLYKIAPDGENPNYYHKSLQQEMSIELVKREIQELKPKYCIILTNLSWWLPFKDGLKTLELDFDKSLDKIESYESFYDSKIIVTKRPPFGNSDEYVRQILELIKKD